MIEQFILAVPDSIDTMQIKKQYIESSKDVEALSPRRALYILDGTIRSVTGKSLFKIEKKPGQFLDFLKENRYTFEDMIALDEERFLVEVDYDFNSPDVKKAIASVSSEMPLALLEVLDISMGKLSNGQGEELTLKHYAESTGVPMAELGKKLESAKDIISKKLQRRGIA